MTKSPLRIGVLGAAFHTGNLGVSALAAGTIQFLLHRFPDAAVFLLDYYREPLNHRVRIDGKDVNVPLVNMRFSKKLYLPNNIAILLLLALAVKVVPYKLRRKLLEGNCCLREIEKADFFVSLAGGDSFSDIYGLGRLLYVALPQILVLLLGKRLILMPQTLGPHQSRFAKAIARYILARAALVYSRDSMSLEEAKALLGHKADRDKFRYCPDLGFIVDPIPPSRTEILGLPEDGDPNSLLIGMNISGLLFMGGYNRNNMFELKTEYATLVLNLIDFLILRKKAKILLVPHVYGAGKQHESDALVCKQAYEMLQDKYGDRIGLASGTYDQNEIKYVIGLCSFFIGSRMHACIAALSQNIPSVLVAYSDKFVRVMQTIGLEHVVTDPRRMDSAEILAIVEQAYDRRAQLRQQLEQKIPQVKEMVFNLFDDAALPSWLHSR